MLWKGTRYTSVQTSICIYKVFPINCLLTTAFLSVGCSQKAVTIDSFLSQEKHRGRGKRCLYTFSLRESFQACKQSKRWSNLRQDEICKIPSRATLLPRVTTPEWTPACKTPLVQKAARQSRPQLAHTLFFPLNAFLNCQLMTKFRAFLHYSRRTFDHQQSWFPASCLLAFQKPLDALFWVLQNARLRNGITSLKVILPYALSIW